MIIEKAQMVVKNARLVSPAGIVRASLVIDRGKVVAQILEDPSGRELAHFSGQEEIDAGDRYILPGLVDPHLHLGLASPEEDFSTETRSAALSGVTTVITYFRRPNPYDQIVPAFIESGEKVAAVDFGLHLGLMLDAHLEQIVHFYSQWGISSFKFYMAYKGAEGDQVGIQGCDDGFLLQGFQEVAKLKGAIACVHAENIEIIQRLKQQLASTKRKDLAAWSETRPPLTEAESIRRAAFLAAEAKCPLYVVHVSSSQGLEEIKRSRRQGLPLYSETCPHYLTHDLNYAGGSLGKVNPPLRCPEDNIALWEGIQDRTIDTLGTDHVAYKKSEKDDNIWEARPGFPGVGTLLPVLLSEGVNKGRLRLERLVEMAAYRPAVLFGLWPRKGHLGVGADADFTMVDLNLERRVTPDDLGSRSDFSLYEGWPLRGWPVLTVLRGQVVARDGVFTGQAGLGKYLSRPYSSSI